QDAIGRTCPAPFRPLQHVAARTAEPGELPGAHEDVATVVDGPPAVLPAHRLQRELPDALPPVPSLERSKAKAPRPGRRSGGWSGRLPGHRDAVAATH